MTNGLRQWRAATVLAVTGVLTLTGCVSTEPVTTPPHVNLSPEDMTFAEPEAGQLDFGMDVARNESDSLENLAVLPGLRVRAVRGGSAAEAAGIRSGDVLLSVNGVETNEPDALAAMARGSEADQFVARVRRGTTVFEATLPRPRQRIASAPEELYRVDPVRSRAGYVTELATLKSGRQRTVARIVELFPESPLAAEGLSKGDMILSVDDQPITTAQGLVDELHSRPLGERLNLGVIAQSEADTLNEVSVRLWEPERRLSSLGLWPLFNYQSSLSPERVEFSLLDFVLFPLFSYEREQGERTIRLLGLFSFGTGYGELVEEAPSTER
ncbi:PDZ domain-containing protein [Proteobacteria bacterium 005FR1]|nr:PDZ domain-containing protein [Proteobacteria bacterium 005FR1]